MKAPERLFVEVCEDGIFAFIKPPFEESIEYIRADLVSCPRESDDLEEEFEKYLSENIEFDRAGSAMDKWNKGCHLNRNDLEDFARHFAEWQRKQDQETIELAEDHAMLAGMNKEREELMKGAVEGEVVKDISNKLAVTAKINLAGFKFGQKVKLIIIPQDDETIND